MATVPKIAMIPSGYKATKVYSVLPTDGGADLTFARAGVANRVASNGLIEEMLTDVPRLDYSDGGCPSLLLEPQSTNNSLYSEDFSNAAWLKGDTTISANAVLSPKGDLTADKVVETATTAQHRVLTNAGLTLSGDVSFSVFAKAGERSIIRITNNNISQGGFFDLTNGVVLSNIGVADSKIKDYGNGWYRCSFTATAGVNERIVINISTDGSTTSYLGDITKGLYLWGAQIEEQSYATSYIPTSGAAATRIADTCSKSGLGSYINSSEGVLYAEVAYFDKDTEQNSITLSDASISNRLTFRRMTTGQLGVVVASGGGSVFSNSSIIALNSNEFYKIAFKYKSGDYAVWLNGVEVLTNTSTTLPLNLSKLELGQGGGSFDELQGKVKDLRVYSEALTDSELQTLTTI